jgi:hypothetical protein
MIATIIQLASLIRSICLTQKNKSESVQPQTIAILSAKHTVCTVTENIFSLFLYCNGGNVLKITKSMSVLGKYSILYKCCFIIETFVEQRLDFFVSKNKINPKIS